MNQVLNKINSTVDLFYDWLFSYPVWKRNLIFLFILILPILLFLQFSTSAMSPLLAVTYIVYLFALIIPYVVREEKENEHD